VLNKKIPSFPSHALDKLTDNFDSHSQIRMHDEVGRGKCISHKQGVWKEYLERLSIAILDFI
jgi:hypothetical protein